MTGYSRRLGDHLLPDWHVKSDGSVDWAAVGGALSLKQAARIQYLASTGMRSHERRKRTFFELLHRVARRGQASRRR